VFEDEENEVPNVTGLDSPTYCKILAHFIDKLKAEIKAIEKEDNQSKGSKKNKKKFKYSEEKTL
jgi:hypothetical protein